ncbi:MAG: DNA helicase RecQ [candidate division Zixibacteria bacterium]|nr:DNA helicase RecQ [candidate division Zixibacteria bacterium]
MTEISAYLNNVRKALKKYWGYDSFMPLQEQAIGCVIERRDSIVVLPTGGGKSLCFQAPAVVSPGLAVVVSPLISLMKDQVDALIECGVPAARIDSTQTTGQQREVVGQIENGALKLIYLSPERLVTDRFIAFLKRQKLSLIAIDEAHCVSMWGHDFRPEYRELGMLRKTFPEVTVHAFTATATSQVRDDIAVQLHLDNPQTLVGSFDRPNLIFKSEPRVDRLRQVRTVLDRHKKESGIIYCIRRKDVDELCQRLNDEGYSALPYHAGLEDDVRKRNQQAFIEEKIHTIVATIAFGMGIDKSNVRYVIHAGMPKSLEHYQQESGRAGRDGLEAECVLFYSGGDYGIWNYLLKDMPEQAGRIARSKLNDMYDYCTGVVCRHRAIVNYFGQELKRDNCGACDVCLGGLEYHDDSLETAQKILSCVIRLDQQYGADYTAMVLTGSQDKKVLLNHHDSLSTYGLLADHSKRMARDWIEQLVGQGFIRKYGEFNVLRVTDLGRLALKGEEIPKLLKPAVKPAKVAKIAADSWAGVDQGLFEALRTLRKMIADKKHVPAYIVFGDAVLRDMARRRPSSTEAFLEVNGVGDMKAQQYGKAFLKAIKVYCRDNDLDMDIDPFIQAYEALRRPKSSSKPSQAKQDAFIMFAQGRSIDKVSETIGRATSTTAQYLEEFIRSEKLNDPSPWVSEVIFKRVLQAAKGGDDGRLKPIFDKLGGDVSYEIIRICLACRVNGQ